MSSSYFKTLNDVNQNIYIEKLTFNEFQLPDLLDEDLRNLVYTNKRWPNISIFDIHAYLVEKHKMYSKLAFKDYASLPCYNYVKSEKVKSMKCYSNDIGVCIVTADVEASQKSKKWHQAWIVASHDGEIITGHCTCMAGFGETCSHVGAILFVIERTVTEEREKPACTSEPCKWNKTSKNVEPLPIAEIDFSTSRKEKQLIQSQEVLPVASDAVFKTFLQNLKIAVPSAGIFTVLSDSEDTDSAEEVECEIYSTFIDKVRTFLQSLPQNSSLAEKQKAFETMFQITVQEKKNIEKETKSNRLKWKAERTGRITASNFGRILKCRNSHESILLDLLFNKDIYTEAIAWGKTMERKAIDKFIEIISPLHVNLCFQSLGLLIDKDEAYLAATPDGLITCDCCEDHILEIKCPFSHREKMISEIEKKNFFLDEEKLLKENHQYYEQVQGQMAISGINKCYFVTFTQKDINYQVVPFDDFKWEINRITLKHFFYTIVLPEIINEKMSDGLKSAAEQCSCKNYKIATTITCIKCNFMFHRSCVSLRSRSRSGWFCDNCKIKIGN